MRDWELTQLLSRFDTSKEHSSVLDTGCVNTFLPIWLSKRSRQVIASDLLGERIYKNALRRIGILKKKPSEAPIERWYRAINYKTSNIRIRSVDITSMPYPDESFDAISSISVIEHIPAFERAIAEMYRCLKNGGKLFITTDCAPEPIPYNKGCRYFSHEELQEIFRNYPVTSPQEEPDFSKSNWCYHKDRPLLTTFIEITKPA